MLYYSNLKDLNSVGAMETGDHSKNGASLKSHKSKRNFKNNEL